MLTMEYWGLDSLPRHFLEMSGQFQAQVALHPGKELTLPIAYETG
jgi:hypothetical protein